MRDVLNESHDRKAIKTCKKKSEEYKKKNDFFILLNLVLEDVLVSRHLCQLKKSFCLHISSQCSRQKTIGVMFV